MRVRSIDQQSPRRQAVLALHLFFQQVAQWPGNADQIQRDDHQPGLLAILEGQGLGVQVLKDALRGFLRAE